MKFLGRALPLMATCVLTGACKGALDPESVQAHRIAELTWILVGLGTLTFLLVMLVLGIALRRRGSAQSSTRSELGIVLAGGIALPLIVLLGLMALTIDALSDLDTPQPGNPLRIEVTGRDWWWDVTYPEEHVRTANEIHVPVGQTVVIKGMSEDAVHSFWVSQMGGKVDLVPGKPREFQVSAEVEGTFRGQCAEFCGIGHAQMALYIIAESPRKFDSWLHAQRAPMNAPKGESAVRGGKIFFGSSCVACHGVQGADSQVTAGPDLTHFASRSHFAGAFWPTTKENLAAWIEDPTSLKPGANMPATDLSPQDLTDLIAFLLSLK